jgi:hypothetical protein
VFFTLLSLFVLTCYSNTGKLHLLLISSFFVAISIFTKYNGLSVLITGVLFLFLKIFIGNSIIKTTKEILIFAIFPITYVTFWKLYNGNLGGVEFDSYIKVVNIDCMIQYLKINILSLYHLILDILFFSLHSRVSHYYLIIPFLVLSTLFIFVFKKQNKIYVKNFLKYNVLLLYILFIIIYLLSMIGIQSLNCLTEPEIRVFLAPTVIFYSLIINYLFFLYNESKLIWKKCFVCF